ncbi:soluble lamin-associated protein of 75 kDa [Acanthochromis polyacanthus]|uniref:soluble lamin-associated protein of 75 kDa n=1 Tax=Acanthochromis polyacanthus TaxID=80966 RepID=UPI0022345256|nr:soluble lamin-associated protein of 75 kDa [Acanthochromis polyacanthus]XP_051806660.1 soluble lamin-associated protein of 75 kDa [Acanthochromis polyacanthus]
MKFPVDLLADVCLAELERSAHNYMNNLLYSNPDSPDHLTISASTKVIIDISSVGFVPLYGSDDTWKILALFSPSDPFIAVGLYLLDRWWAVEDILKTADPARDGVLKVETVGDRIVLYILNRVIYRGKEITSDELPFLCHGEKDYAKIVWNNGEAVGFYSVKPSGTICNSFSVRTYQLSVMDSIFIRKCQRRKGFGLQMLVDFVLSFKEESLGLRYPLTKSMYKVCEKYLCQYPGDADLLWEVESIGGPKQRTNIARKIMAIDISVSKNLSFSEETLLTADVAEKVLKETTAVEHTVEIMEEVTVFRATKEFDNVPVVNQRRSSRTKQRKTGEKMTEDKSEKVIRIEEIEAETPRKESVSVQRKTELHDSEELEQTEVLLSVFKEKAEDVVDTVPEGGPTMGSNKPATVLTSEDLAEDHVTSATMTEEQHIEEDATQDLNNKFHDSQITVENVASETQEAEVCEKEEEADIPFGEDAEENILSVELDEKMSRKDEETPANNEQVQSGYEDETPVIERRVLRSGKKTVRATTRIKTTKDKMMSKKRKQME